MPKKVKQVSQPVVATDSSETHPTGGPPAHCEPENNLSPQAAPPPSPVLQAPVAVKKKKTKAAVKDAPPVNGNGKRKFQWAPGTNPRTYPYVVFVGFTRRMPKAFCQTPDEVAALIQTLPLDTRSKVTVFKNTPVEVETKVTFKG